MSDSVRPQRLQPTKPCRPWDSPGKNTGVGCHFCLQSMKVKSESEVTQSCLTLYDPMDCSLPASSVRGIFQARIVEWVAVSFSRGSSQTRIKPRSLALQADSLPSEPPRSINKFSVLKCLSQISPSYHVLLHWSFADYLKIDKES